MRWVYLTFWLPHNRASRNVRIAADQNQGDYNYVLNRYLLTSNRTFLFTIHMLCTIINILGEQTYTSVYLVQFEKWISIQYTQNAILLQRKKTLTFKKKYLTNTFLKSVFSEIRVRAGVPTKINRPLIVRSDWSANQISVFWRQTS